VSRTLVHLSDVHFGRVDPATVEPLVAAVTEIHPDVVTVSGDLTMRARTAEFLEARAFLDRLPKPQVVVPGNHDVPAYNPYQRFFAGFEKFRMHITDNLSPEWIDDEIAVFGVNTARALSVKNGRLSITQIEELRRRLLGVSHGKVKVVVTHHPLDMPESYGSRHLVWRARMAMEWLVACGADLLLAGHHHVTHAISSERRYEIEGHPALVVQAGTATSTRGRGEVNSFNRIVTSPGAIEVEMWSWDGHQFAVARRDHFVRSGNQWAIHPTLKL
jgi:3',5'-cyclic AMP phosphodiesterase CpdA